MKLDNRLSPLGIISSNECWLNVGPVLASIGPTPTHNSVLGGGEGAVETAKDEFCIGSFAA